MSFSLSTVGNFPFETTAEEGEKKAGRAGLYNLRLCPQITDTELTLRLNSD